MNASSHFMRQQVKKNYSSVCFESHFKFQLVCINSLIFLNYKIIKFTVFSPGGTDLVYASCSRHCVVPENIHIHPIEGHWRSRGRGRVSTATIFKGIYEPKLNIPGGGVDRAKKPSMGGGMRYFWSLTFC